MRKAIYVKREYLKEKSEVEYNANNYKARIYTLGESYKNLYIKITPKGEDYFYKYEIDAISKNYDKRGQKKITKQISPEKKKEINKIIKEILFPNENIKIKETEIINDALRILLE